MEQYWHVNLTAFDAQLCTMIESLTGVPVEPKNGGDHYFIEASYKEHHDPDYIAAMMDAIAGRAGSRLIEMKDDPERECLLARIRFYSEPCKDAAFIPKIEEESKCCICGKPVEIDEDGIEDDGGNVWCAGCLDEFLDRVGALIEQMKREKAHEQEKSNRQSGKQ